MIFGKSEMKDEMVRNQKIQLIQYWMSVQSN